ncbi:MAG TPA: branched-chain amino acid ABC transporter permease [Anaerolineales bacterium]|nr:branched-chain amino acid ABC transporter permease [Anaerolineales bacterium]HRF50280.1 branched-chain amino acid ABC transporter permease [Anaerolineales bacterium]
MTETNPTTQRALRILLIVAIGYLALLIGQPAGLDVGRIITDIVKTPTNVVQQLVIGLANGSIIVIIALGYTLVYGIIELVNFAHGEVFMLGAFTALMALSIFTTTTATGGLTAPFWAALLGFIPAMVLCGLLNAGIERLAYRRLRNSPKLAVLISAIGMSFILQNIGLQFGALGKLTQVGPEFQVFQVLGSNNAAPKSFPVVLSTENLLGDFPIRITQADVLVMGAALVLMLALNWFVQSTRLGKAMRAVAQNRDAAAMMGINVDQIIALTFLIGGALAGAAGMMFGLYNGTVVFTMGFTAGLRSFTAAVLGGIGNIRGAALGGILIGLLAAFSDQYLAVRWTNAWVFLILVLVLLFRPTGLLGQESGDKA